MDILKPSRKIKGWIMYTVEPPQQPPPYNGHFFWRTVHTLTLV